MESFYVPHVSPSLRSRTSSTYYTVIPHPQSKLCCFVAKRAYQIQGILLSSVGILASLSREKKYRGAEKSLARPGRKQANISVRMA